jgi:phage baseplate assembly protein W
MAVATQKAKTYTRLGADIALTRYSGVPSSVPLSVADSWGVLDLQVVPGGKGGLPQSGDILDAGAIAGRANLAQALILRLLTRQGALRDLGHPDYGCRLVELIGELNNDTTRNLARLFTLQAIAQEPRVKQLLDLSVVTVADQPDTIRISFSVLPVDDDDPLALTLEVTL